MPTFSKGMLLLLQANIIIFSAPQFHDSLYIPGCKYYITSNDSMSGLDSISKRCKNYYYFSNGSNTYNYGCKRTFIITKENSSPACTLYAGSFGSIGHSFPDPECDSLSEKIHTSINAAYFYDTIFFKWEFQSVLGKIRNSRDDLSQSPGLLFSLHSNTDTADLYLAKPGISVSAIKNTVQSRPVVMYKRIGLISGFHKNQKPAFRVIYNIRGQMIPAIPEDGISIGLN